MFTKLSDAMLFRRETALAREFLVFFLSVAVCPAVNNFHRISTERFF